MMKCLLLLVAVGAGVCAFSLAVQAEKPADADATKKSGSVLRHVVLFKFKDGTKPEQIKAVEAAFAALPTKIDTIADFEWGTDVSPEGKSQGLTHCFFVTFRDEKGRDAYLPHAAHKEFVSLVGPVIDKAVVVDYWSKK